MSKSVYQYKQELLKKDKNKCHYCRKPITFDNMQVEHVLAVSRGGGDELSNLVAACEGCNRKKWTMLVGDFKVEIYQPVRRESKKSTVDKVLDIFIGSDKIRVYGRGGRRIR